MRTIPMLLGASLLAACGQSAPVPRDMDSGKAEVLAANAAYVLALVDGNPLALSRTYASDYSTIDDDAGVHDRRDQIQLVVNTIDVLEAKNDEVRVKMLGPDAALVTGRLSGTYRAGSKEQPFTERYTSIWVRQGKDWLIRHDHSSMVPQAAQQGR